MGEALAKIQVYYDGCPCVQKGRCKSSALLATHQYVLLYEVDKDLYKPKDPFELSTIHRAGLFYTANDGFLHPVWIVNRNTTVAENVNTVKCTYKVVPQDVEFRLQDPENFVRWEYAWPGRPSKRRKGTGPTAGWYWSYEKKNSRYLKKIHPRTEWGMFFWEVCEEARPGPLRTHATRSGRRRAGVWKSGMGVHVGAKAVARAKKQQPAKQQKKNGQRQRTVVVPVKLRCSYWVYYEALRRQTKALRRLIADHQEQIRDAIAASSAIDQVRNNIVGHGKTRLAKGTSPMKLPADHLGLTRTYSLTETRALEQALLQPAYDRAKVALKTRMSKAEKAIRPAAERLHHLLTCPEHQRLFEVQFALELRSEAERGKGKGDRSGGVPYSVRSVYADAYRLLSRTPLAKKIYSAQLAPFLRLCLRKDSAAINRVLSPPKDAHRQKASAFEQSVKKSAVAVGFVRALRSELLDVMDAYAFMTLSRKLTKPAKDLKNFSEAFEAAMQVLEHKGLARNTAQLKTALENAIQTGAAVDAEPFLAKGSTPGAVKAFNRCANGLKIAAAAYKLKSDKWKDKADGVKDVIDVGVEISKFDGFEPVFRKATSKVIERVGGLTSATLDWAIAVHDLQDAAERADKDPSEFWSALVSYGSKTVIMGGHGLALVQILILGTNPWGLAVIAAATAVDLAVQVYKLLKDYKTTEYEQYKRAVAALQKLDRGTRVHGKFDEAGAESVSTTAVYKESLKDANLGKDEQQRRQVLHEAWRGKGKDGLLTLHGLATAYFNNPPSWGLMGTLRKKWNK